MSILGTSQAQNGRRGYRDRRKLRRKHTFDSLRGAGAAHGDGEEEGLCGLEPVDEHRRQRGPS